MVKIVEIIGKIILAFVLAFIATMIFTLPVMIYLFATGQATMEELLNMGQINNRVFTYGAGIAQAFGFITAALLMYTFFERIRNWPMGWKQPQPMRECVKGAAAGIALMTACFVLIWLFGGFSITSVQWNTDVVIDLCLSFILFVFVAVNEELFARGYVMGLIRYHYGTTAAVIGSSLLFTLLHTANPGALDNPLPLLNLFAAGVLLAVGRVVSGGLWFPIGLHLTWNFFQGNVFGFAVSGNEVNSVIRMEPQGASVISGGSFGAEGSLVTMIVIFIAAYAVARLYRRKAS